MAIKEIIDQLVAAKAAHEDAHSGLLNGLVNELSVLETQLGVVRKALDALVKLPPA